ADAVFIAILLEGVGRADAVVVGIRNPIAIGIRQDWRAAAEHAQIRARARGEQDTGVGNSVLDEIAREIGRACEGLIVASLGAVDVFIHEQARGIAERDRLAVIVRSGA